MVGKTEPSTFAILCTALLNGTPQCRVWGSARARFGLHWMGANFKQPPVHRIFFDAYGKAWQRRSGGRKTRALQSVRVQSNQYLEILNDNHFHFLEASAAARSSQQELCYVHAILGKHLR